MVAFSNISTYVVRAVTWPSDCDDFFVNLQSSEQATEDVSACMKQSSTETVPCASETLPCQIVFHVFFGVTKACKETEKEPCPEILLLAGRGARRRAEGLQAGAALCLAVCVAGVRGRCDVSCRVPLALQSPAPPCREQVQGQRAGQPGLCATKPAAQQLHIQDWHGGGCFWSNTSAPSGFVGEKAQPCCPLSTQPLRKTTLENSRGGMSHFSWSESWIFWGWSNLQVWGIWAFARVCVCVSY